MELSAAEASVVHEFHRLFYDGAAGKQRPYENVAWMGVPCLKCPLDLWCYQEILVEIRPDLIVETGTFMGGSALFLANLCDLIGNGRVVSIDVETRVRPEHPRITYLEGSSIADPVVEKVREFSRGAGRVLVILDSDHSQAHVQRELELFAPLVTPGSFLIVEDTNVNGHPVHAAFGPGPYEAVSGFLSSHLEFSADRSREKFYLTFNPRGFLKRAQAEGVTLPVAQAAPVPSVDRTVDALSLARQILAYRERELDSKRGELSTVGSALKQAMAQLEAAHNANAGFEAAVAQLTERDAQLAEARRLLDAAKADLAGARAVVPRRDTGGWLAQTDAVPAAPAGSGTIAVTTYEGRIDLRVKNNSHTIAHDFIAQSAGGARWRILEAGCGAGHFGEAVRQAGHEVWGAETSHEAAGIAQRRLDRVFLGTVEDLLDSMAGQEPAFDCITFGDVLEHLVDPLAVLQRSMSSLTRDGIIVASIPNVAHMAVRLMLLEGRWEYSDRGILDRTHLHFYTKRSLVKLFSDAGYWIEAIAPVRLPHDLTGIAVNQELLRATNVSIMDDGADVFQYVVLARPATQGRPTAANDRFANDRFYGGNGDNVLCLMPVEDGSLGDIRLKNPLRKWTERHGGSVRFKWLGDYSSFDLEWADIVVFQRESHPGVLDLIDDLHREGKRVVFDIDDLLTEIPEFLSTYEHSRRVRPYLEKALGMADAVTVTTARLRDRFLALQASTFIVPNCPRPAGVVAHQRDDVQAPVTLLVASSDSVRVDFLIPALRMIASDKSLKVTIVGIGPPGKAIRDAGVPINCVDNLPYEQFLWFVGGMDNPVGLIPLDDSVFSGCKSPIKYFDYSMCGVVSVCSNVPPYSDFVQHGVTGLLVNDTAESWYGAVKQLAASPASRQRLAAAASAYCANEYPLSRAADAWQEVFLAVRAKPAAAPTRPKRGPTVKDWLRLARQPAAYRSAARIVAREGWQGVRKRIKRLHG